MSALGIPLSALGIPQRVLGIPQRVLGVTQRPLGVAQRPLGVALFKKEHAATTDIYNHTQKYIHNFEFQPTPGS
jgi:hypothetical protein